jgi:hypothetical protein
MPPKPNLVIFEFASRRQPKLVKMQYARPASPIGQRESATTIIEGEVQEDLNAPNDELNSTGYREKDPGSSEIPEVTDTEPSSRFSCDSPDLTHARGRSTFGGVTSLFTRSDGRKTRLSKTQGTEGRVTSGDSVGERLGGLARKLSLTWREGSRR